MNKIHEDLYNALVLIGKRKETYRIRQELNSYLALEEYIIVNDKEEVRITNKGLELLKSLEDIKHNETSRTIMVWSMIVSGLFSLLALVISIISLNKGG
ncbi:hypothetical protein HZA99_05195 [Candidatus Woesearchaeota archaeon]|nr:hypothetical protein [Candidatus Woesearchaeota archaeon]